MLINEVSYAPTAEAPGRIPQNQDRFIPASYPRLRSGKQKTANRLLWFDTKRCEQGQETFDLLTRALQWRYNGVICYPESFRKVLPALPRRVLSILDVNTSQDVPNHELGASDHLGLAHQWSIDVIASHAPDVLAYAKGMGYKTCLRVRVEDRASLERCVENGAVFDYVLVSFEDPTNIPLELIIATLQSTDTELVKEISSPDDVDDAVVALGIMEVGSEGVLYTPDSHENLTQFIARIEATQEESITLDIGTVVRSQPLGMGTRTCIDATTLFSPTEGVLVGSTSSGGILCCPEVFFLPYMDLRPFRVNAGAIHSYVFNLGDRTDYMSEIKAGSTLMIVDQSGRARKAYVGRTKTEVRPLRLIEVEFANGQRVNVILQDDWHVRIFSDAGLPLNITTLKPGDKVLGHMTEPGRHVGIRVSEQILEK